MNLLKKWWDIWQPKCLEDEVFGSLRPQGNGIFTGEGHFYPTGKSVQIYINGLESGPSDAQRSFYIKLQQTFPVIKDKMLPFLRRELKRPTQDFDLEFPIHAISIPNVLAPFFEWDMTFHMKHDPKHFCTVYFQVWEPTGVGID
jgi:hypothetical protein